MFGKKKREKKRRKSLSKSIQRLVLSVAVIILVVASVLSLIGANRQFSSMFATNSRQVVNSMRTVLEIVGGFDEYSKDVIDTWRELPEDVRMNTAAPEYLSHFVRFEASPYYKKIVKLLNDLQGGITMGDMYVAALDEKTDTLINLIDPDNDLEAEHYTVGMWDQLTAEQVALLLNPEGEAGIFTEQTDRIGPIIVYGMLITDEEGSLPILAMYDFPILASSLFTFAFVTIYVILLGAIILIIILITRSRIKKRLVRPINTITSAAEQYVESKQKNPDGMTGCFGNLDIHTGDELEELGDVMAQMERDIGIYEQDLTQAATEKAHIQTELSVATAIQSHMLPDASTAFPDRKDFSVFATMNPAREVGGDFYDFFLIDEDHLGIVIADVSGKGIPAALFMMSSMIIINNFAMLGFSPKEVLEKANAKICSSNVLNMFVTVWFGILDLKTGTVTAANAGHEYPAIEKRETGFELLKDKHGLVIGGMEGVTYKEYSFTLDKEESIFVYTDGVAEATDAQDELYGTDRMLAALNSAKGKSVGDICGAVAEDINRFVKDAPQFDDITMVCIRYHGPRE